MDPLTQSCCGQVSGKEIQQTLGRPRLFWWLMPFQHLSPTKASTGVGQGEDWLVAWARWWWEVLFHCSLILVDAFPPFQYICYRILTWCSTIVFLCWQQLSSYLAHIQLNQFPEHPLLSSANLKGSIEVIEIISIWQWPQSFLEGPLIVRSPILAIYVKIG